MESTPLDLKEKVEIGSPSASHVCQQDLVMELHNPTKRHSLWVSM